VYQRRPDGVPAGLSAEPTALRERGAQARDCVKKDVEIRVRECVRKCTEECVRECIGANAGNEKSVKLVGLGWFNRL
jgi:hypothetical protein